MQEFFYVLKYKNECPYSSLLKIHLIFEFTNCE